MAVEAVEKYNEYSARRIVTLSPPHCLTAFKKLDGLKSEVIHYTQLLAELIEKGQLSFQAS